MKFRQWEVWKAKPSGFETPHWFVLLSPHEVLDNPHDRTANGFVCFSLRGSARRTEVILNGADGFERPTICVCNFVYVLEKSALHDGLGLVSWERQQTLKSKLKEVFRL